MAFRRMMTNFTKSFTKGKAESFVIDPKKANMILIKNDKPFPYMFVGICSYIVYTTFNKSDKKPNMINKCKIEELIKAYVEKNNKKFIFINGQINQKMVDHVFYKIYDLDNDDEIDVVINTNGGELDAGFEICDLIKHHPGKSNAIVPRNALSCGTMIALACDEIKMSDTAYLSPVDPQLALSLFPIQFSSVSFNNVLKKIPTTNIFVAMIHDMTNKVANDTKEIVSEYLDEKSDKENKNAIMDMLFEQHIHSHRFTTNKLSEAGLKISDIPIEYEKIFFDVNNQTSLSNSLDIMDYVLKR